MYRQRWSHDKVVRTTHGVNCTGSCSWKVFVKNGIITWENQQIDYPSCGPDMPEFEPRGCPRGASFSWYEYSPLRVKYPYLRGKLWRLWRNAIAEHQDPVKAWASIVEDPEKANEYKKSSWKRWTCPNSLARCNTNYFSTTYLYHSKIWSRPSCWIYTDSCNVHG